MTAKRNLEKSFFTRKFSFQTGLAGVTILKWAAGESGTTYFRTSVKVTKVIFFDLKSNFFLTVIHVDFGLFPERITIGYWIGKGSIYIFDLQI